MNNIATQKCFNHASREAVARCPQCSRFFCRECITEHDDKVICATCLKLIAAKPKSRHRSMHVLLAGLHCTAALVSLWLVFYSLGYMLLRLPAAFHEGRLWNKIIP